ncbi:hypothetical protein [Accumulibacter sp.]|jgi:hypothetical protein|uniref:hypothetical protein n=1 Tax=Accumulibacter sp. TaxID=2053492 RepID=UPI00258BE09A|nr:hypothetical protein [Accumulibacter sp.]
MLTRNLSYLLSLLLAGAVVAQEEGDPDPDAMAQMPASPRNPDMIRTAIDARLRVHRSEPAPQATPASPQTALTERELRQFAARGLGPTVNVCSVVQNGRGSAQAPVLQNTRVDINCQTGEVVVGR